LEDWKDFIEKRVERARQRVAVPGGRWRTTDQRKSSNLPIFL
jgi:hypothetical protein